MTANTDRIDTLVEVVIDRDWDGDIRATLEGLDGDYFQDEGGFDLDASVDAIADGIRDGVEDALDDDLDDDDVIRFASLPATTDSGFDFWVESD
ncbi:hypothetical protein G3N30_06030 [Microbacterium lacticum]|uniref:hypothetical protein n=1 Tax=Microbacterium lacticum TaxID=33885 RepID=UPI0018B0C86E|nr:hypothetical protein [Microbacterium lacticum]MBF9335808.1 hypothetical protein [Microbacterium lacticum]